MLRRLQLLGSSLGIIAVAAACDPPTPPPDSAEVRMRVEFLAPPAALSSIVTTLSATDLPTATITLTPQAGTNNQVWNGGPVTVTAATYDVNIVGLNGTDTTYRGTGRLTAAPGSNNTHIFALVCVSTACENGSASVSITVLVPTPEVEPNDNATPQTLGTFAFWGDQIQAAIVNGRIAEPVDTDDDWFRIPWTGVAAGDTLIVEVFAERFGSTLDPIVYVYDPNGNFLTLSSDVVGKDPRIVFAIPSGVPSGNFTIRVNGFGPTTGRYTLFAVLCDSGPPAGVFCL